MSRHAFERARDGLPIVYEDKPGLPSQANPSNVRVYLHRVWADLKLRFTSTRKLRFPFSTRKDTPELPASQQENGTANVPSHESPNRDGVVRENQTSSHGWRTDSIVSYNYGRQDHPGLNGEHSLAASSHENSKMEESNDSYPYSDTSSVASINSIARRRQGLHLNTGIRFDGVSSSSPNELDNSSPLNVAEERERTLRTLESGGIPTTPRSSSPATLRRHRRSYQLATDPRIDPEQYSNFLDFLDHNVSMDVSVRIWRSVLKDSEMWEESLIEPGHAHDAGSHGQPSNRQSIATSTGDPGSGSNHRVSDSNNSKVGLQGNNRVLVSEHQLLRRQTQPIDLNGIGTARPIENGSQRHNATRKKRYSVEYVPREAIDSRRRRLSASSLAHSFTQYIKPEVPVAVNREPRSAPGPSDPNKVTSQTTVKPGTEGG